MHGCDKEYWISIKTVADGRGATQVLHNRPASVEQFSIHFFLTGELSGLRPQQHVPQEPINILYICKSSNRPSIILTEGRAAFGYGLNSSSQAEAPGNSVAQVIRE